MLMVRPFATSIGVAGQPSGARRRGTGGTHRGDGPDESQHLTTVRAWLPDLGLATRSPATVAGRDNTAAVWFQSSSWDTV